MFRLWHFSPTFFPCNWLVGGDDKYEVITCKFGEFIGRYIPKHDFDEMAYSAISGMMCLQRLAYDDQLDVTAFVVCRVSIQHMQREFNWK